ncbi:MAG: response regulator [Deltaproteobacteria bacterium]|nr:response regulator [Deltaproteobacteria bacterium]
MLKTSKKWRIPTRWCPYCGADVEVVVLLERGDELTHCTLCNRAIAPDVKPGERREPPAAGASRTGDDLSADDWERLLSDVPSKKTDLPAELESAFVEAPAAGAAKARGAEVGFLETVVVADDSTTIRAEIEEVFRSRGFARDVICFENGRELIQGYVQIKEAGGDIGLVVLDLEMPVMNGLVAAQTLRQVEKQKKYDPAMILFFSGRRRDPKLDAALQKFRPSMYIGKGDADQRTLRSRLSRIVDLLREELK